MIQPIWSSGVNICLRCQARLGNRPLFRSATTQLSTATFSTTRRRAYEAQKQQPVHPRYDDTDSQTQTKDGDVIYKHIRPRGRIRGRRGKEVVEEAAVLDIGSLGRPSEIIMLKDAHFDKDEDTGRSAGEEKDAQEHAATVATAGGSQNIMKSIENAKIEPSQDDVNADIDALRKKYTALAVGHNQELPYMRFNKLRILFTTRYNKSQLIKYIEHMQHPTTHASAESQKWPQSETSVTRSRWRPGRHKPNFRLLPQATISQQHSERKPLEKGITASRAELISDIIAVRWNLQVEGQEGELDIQLPTAPLAELLEAGAKPTILHRLSQQHSVSFFLSRKHLRLRIRGTYKSASAAADEIVALLHDTKQCRLDLEGLHDWLAQRRLSWGPFFTKPHLKRALHKFQAALEFTSDISADSTKQRPLVSEQSLILHTMDQAELDNVRQALLQLLDFPRAGDVVTSWVTSEPSWPLPHNALPDQQLHSDAGFYRNITQYDPKDSGKPRSDKEQSVPSQSTQPVSDNGREHVPTPVALDDKFRAQSYSVEINEKTHLRVDRGLFWNTTSELSTTCRLGLYLHTPPAKATTAQPKELKKRQKALSTNDFVPLEAGDHFTTSVPHVVQWLFKQHKDPSRTIAPPSSATSQLRFSFLPTPFSNTSPVPLTRYAAIELVVNTDPLTGQYVDSSWIAQLGQASLILPLPALSTDVVFIRSCQLAARGTGDDDLQDCVNQVKDSIARGGKLTAPPSISLSAPRVSYSDVDTHPWRRPWGLFSWKSRPPNDIVQYLFAGVSLRQSVEMKWTPKEGAPDYRLAYTNITGGDLVGQRSELALHLPDEGNINHKGGRPAKTRREFFAAAMELAKQVSAAGGRRLNSARS